jgi:lactoylglutathione lyase
MHIEHVAIWTANLEQLKDFYMRYFQAAAGNKYTNPDRGFQSIFLTFSSGARLELMSMPSILVSQNEPEIQFTGLIHLAISVGSMEQVDSLTAQLDQDGYRILDSPRHTGDGYYESVVLDPDSNRVEITI